MKRNIMYAAALLPLLVLAAGMALTLFAKSINFRPNGPGEMRVKAPSPLAPG